MCRNHFRLNRRKSTNYWLWYVLKNVNFANILVKLQKRGTKSAQIVYFCNEFRKDMPL